MVQYSKGTFNPTSALIQSLIIYNIPAEVSNVPRIPGVIHPRSLPLLFLGYGRPLGSPDQACCVLRPLRHDGQWLTCISARLCYIFPSSVSWAEATCRGSNTYRQMSHCSSLHELAIIDIIEINQLTIQSQNGMLCSSLIVNSIGNGNNISDQIIHSKSPSKSQRKLLMSRRRIRIDNIGRSKVVNIQITSVVKNGMVWFNRTKGIPKRRSEREEVQVRGTEEKC